MQINKIIAMQAEKFNGYASAFASLCDPVRSPTPISLAERKEEETLIGYCLKQLIK